MKKTPVDIPYIVRLRMKSPLAQRIGAKAWYEWPLKARERRAAKIVRAIEHLFVTKQNAQRMPISGARFVRDARDSLIQELAEALKIR